MKPKRVEMVSEKHDDSSDDDAVDPSEVLKASHPSSLRTRSAASQPSTSAAKRNGSGDAEEVSVDATFSRFRQQNSSGRVYKSSESDRDSGYAKKGFDRAASALALDVDSSAGEAFAKRMLNRDRQAKETENNDKSRGISFSDTVTINGEGTAELILGDKDYIVEDNVNKPTTKRRRRRRWDTGVATTDVSATEVDVSDFDTIESVNDNAKSKVDANIRRRQWGEISGSASASLQAVGSRGPDILDTKGKERIRQLTDAELDSLLNIDGYEIVPVPPDYKPLKRRNHDAPSADEPSGSVGYSMPPSTGFVKGGESLRGDEETEIVASDGTTLPPLRRGDLDFFGKLLEKEPQARPLSTAEANERFIMGLLLKIKNGLPSQRKVAMKQITLKARELGAGPLFNQILALLMSPTLEDHERHLMVKVIDRILYRLDDMVRPYTHKILVVIEPMLIDENYYARAEAREIIANLSKAAGLPTMLSTIRPDVDNPDEYVRNTTSRALAVVASALGISRIVPFLRAVCRSRKSWYARHTGIKTVQQIAIMLGCVILPFLAQLIDIVGPGLNDSQAPVRTMTALALASLAESAHPYGIESFDPVLEPLWRGVRQHHGKPLAAFLKAIGNIIPLMDDDEYASYFTKQVMAILVREFRNPDEEMRRTVLKVVQQCVSSDGVTAEYVRKELVPEFVLVFWGRRSALDRRTATQIVEASHALAKKVGCAEIMSSVANCLKDDSEPLRRMAMECITNLVDDLGVTDVSEELEARLVDGTLFAFQEQAASILASQMAQPDGSGGSANMIGERERNAMLDGFGSILKALGLRSRPYLSPIVGTIKFRLSNKDAFVRGQAAELVSRISRVMAQCGEEQLLGQLGVVLFESLGEEYPGTLASVLTGLRGIVSVIGIRRMQPPIKDLVPRLTPILKNQNLQVQEAAIDLIGRIADRGAEFVSAREWMRICFEVIEMLRAKKKSIRRASVSTFGYIAKAVGPHDVLQILLNTLRSSDRTLRVCTTVAIAIVAETCGPFTVLPGVLNEYRVTDINVQNGCLKTLSFMFEYIGPVAKDYIYATVTLLEDALTDKDPVHRQTACTVVKHLALGVQGLGCEDALQHLLNFVWPNIFEAQPHVIAAVFDAIEALRVSLGSAIIFMHVAQGLFHPARRVREVYWRIYNNLYVYSAPSLVPVYPRLEDDYELDLPVGPDGMLALGARKNALLELLTERSELRPPKVRNSYRRTYLELFV